MLNFIIVKKLFLKPSLLGDDVHVSFQRRSSNACFMFHEIMKIVFSKEL